METEKVVVEKEKVVVEREIAKEGVGLVVSEYQRAKEVERVWGLE